MDRKPTIREGMTKRQKLHHYLMTDVMRRLEYDLHQAFHENDAIPEAWQEIATRPSQPKKQQITMRIDEDVVKFFRTTGQGYQTKMNDVLRAYMQSRLAGVVVDGSRFERYVEDREDGLDHADAEFQRLSERYVMADDMDELMAEYQRLMAEREGE